MESRFRLGFRGFRFCHGFDLRCGLLTFLLLGNDHYVDGGGKLGTELERHRMRPDLFDVLR